MKFIRYLVLIFIITSCSKKQNDTLQTYPPYKLIIDFSKKIRPQTDLTLSLYGINSNLPRDYEIKNGIGGFKTSYSLGKLKDDHVSLASARNLIIFIAENFLKEINTNAEIKPELDIYPFTSDLINISVYFEDENKIQLGQGVALIYFSHGKIKYEGYNIKEYRHRPPAIGKHYTIHEETYAEALDIVKKQGNLVYLE